MAAAKKPKGRKRSAIAPSTILSRITNGSRLLDGIDARSKHARRWRDLYRDFLARTGGHHDQGCRQLASLIVAREILDARLARGEDVNSLHLVRLAGAINRTLARLNLAADDNIERKRRAREDAEAGLSP